ncbi:MAG: PKD domain-containing protein [Bacteroidales bacterium]|nr:PKD domain-containing protein [Bacteroidales bacterium]
MSYLKNLKRLKYTSLLICVFLFSKQYTSAQTTQTMLTVDSYRITVKGNDSLYVNGTVSVKENSSQTDNLHIEGGFILTDTLINNVDSLFLTSTNPALSNDSLDRLLSTSMGEVIFRDNRDKFIKSRSSIFFTDLTVDQGKLVLDTSVKVIKVLGEIDLDQGDLYLNGSNIELYDLFETINLTSGKIKSGAESNDFKIYDDSTGFIKAVKYYKDSTGTDDYSPNDPANLGFSVDSPEGINKIFITRFHESDTTVTDGGIKKSYLINIADEDVNLGASKNLQFSYFESDLFGDLIDNDSSLRIFFKSFESERYQYIGSDSIGNNDIYVNGVNFNEGYYTIADSICDNPPRVNLGANRIVCEGDEINLIADPVYTDDDDEGLMAYKWWSPDFVIDNSDELNNTTLSVSSSTINNFFNDTLSIYISVADKRGCINYDTIQFYIFQNPELNIQTNVPSSEFICIGDIINLYDTKNSEGEYRWTFDQEPYLDTLESPSYVYRNQDGLHEVKLEYTDSNGCEVVSQIQLEIHSLPEPSFIVDNENCLGSELFLENASFLNTENISGVISTYSWDMGNGNQITITPNEIVSDSNLVYLTDTIRDNGGIPGPDLTYWYNKIGSYNIRLTAETYSECINDTVISVHVYDSVYAAFDTILTNVCLGVESRFIPGNTTSDTNLVAEYQWHFNDTVIISNFLDDTVNYQFEESGTYSVSFIAVSKFGCTDTLTQNINIYAAPTAIFTVDPVCLNTNSEFISSGSSPSSIDYIWYLEDTTIYSSSDVIVDYAFNNAGKHKVELEIAFNNGCKSTFTDSAIVLANPDASFTVTNACVNNQGDPLIVNTSSNLNSEYNWDFGDGTITESEQPIKTYKDAGKYNVTLNAKSDYIINNLPLRCNTVYTDSINIFNISSANFKVDEYTNVCEGNTSAFVLSELVNTQFVDHYEWDFVIDTVISYPPDQVDYDFSNDGTYNVTLKTVTEDGCIYKATNTIEILNTPDAVIITDSVCEGEELMFSIPENIRNANDEYSWYLDNTFIGNGWYASSIKPQGTYQLILNIKTPQSCENKDTSYAVIHELPSDIFQNEINVCSDTLQLVGENIEYDYLWNDILSGDSYTVTYDQICELVKTDKITGCQSNETIEVSLKQPLNVEIGNDTSVCGNIVLDAGYFGSTAIYNWSNGETSRYINVNTSNKYKVTVDEGVCSVSDSIQIIVNTIPTIDLGADIEICAFETVNLNAEIPDGLSYVWSNDEITSNIEVNSDIAQSLNYRVTVSDVNNCIASDQIKLTFNPVPNLDLGADITTCQNIDVVLNASIVNGTYLWSTGDTDPILFPSENGSNIITKDYSVIATNQYTCVSKDTVSVQFNPVPELILQDEIIACGNEEVKLSAYNPDIISYAWNNGSIDSVLTINPQTDGEGIYYVTIENQYNCMSTSNQTNVAFKTIPNPILPDEITGCNEINLDAGNFGAEFLWNDNITTQGRTIYESGLYTLEITNGSNCSIIDSIEATVNYVTKPYMGPDISMCTNDQKVLRTGIHDSEYTFEWNGYSTGDTMLIATPGTYIVRAMHSNACEDSDTIEVIGRTLPSLDLGPDIYKCTNDNIILDAGDEGLAYFWESSNGIVASDRLFEVPDTGKYWVQVTNEYSCSQSDTILIKHTSLSIEPLFITNSKLVAADSVLFVDMSQPEPVSWLWEFGDLQQSILQNPVHVYYGGGNYQVILHASNSVCNASIVKIIEVENRDKLGDEEEGEAGLFGDKFIEIQNVKVYPNPTNGNFTIEAELSARSNANLYIFDLMGRLIKVSKFNDVEILNQDIDIQGKGAGIYIIKIIAGTDHKTYKIIKQ